MNILKLKCHRCGDVLTDGELRTNYSKSRPDEKKFTCYQCSQKIWQEVKARLEVDDDHDCHADGEDGCDHPSHIQI